MLRLWQFGIGVDNFDVADMVVVVVAAAVDGRMSWNLNGGTVQYGLMIVEKTIGLSAIDDCDIGKDVDVDEEGTCRRTPMVVVVAVTQQHRGEDTIRRWSPRINSMRRRVLLLYVCLITAVFSSSVVTKRWLDMVR